MPQNYTFNEEQLAALNSMMPLLHQLEQQLKPVVNKQTLDTISNLQSKLQEAMGDIWQKEQDEQSVWLDYVEELRLKHNFTSYWAVGKVDFDDKVLVKSVSYSTNWGKPACYTILKPQEITWLEMWKIADTLIKQSNDCHHRFIEKFEPLGDNKFNLITGS